jgi:hypothetical protein
MSTSWTPLLSGALRDRALATVEALLGEVLATPREGLSAGLLEGHAGQALFFDMAARAMDPRLLEQVGVSLERAVEGLSRSRPSGPGLHAGGLTDIAWVAAHLAAHHPGLDVEEVCSAADEALEEALRQSPWPLPCDLRDGLAGIGLYALERVPHPSGRRLLERVVAKLEETARPLEEGLSWPMPQRFWALYGQEATFPRGLYTLGVAHGVPPALAILAAAHALGVERERAHVLLEKGFRWVETLASPEGHPRFPLYLHGSEPFPDPHGRFSWCAGNPGITAVLAWAAQRWGDPAWRARTLGWACEVAREALERPAPHHSNLCCGAAGTAHLFHRLFRATGVPLFEEAAVRWLQHTLALPPPTVANLQFGAAGTALALLAATSELEPKWDSAFLFSLP